VLSYRTYREHGRDRTARQAWWRLLHKAAFVYLHAVLYFTWIIINVGLIPALPKPDPSLSSLATLASCEAIFLSTFVLISQNRMAAAERKRGDLDLHVSLLAEHELTQLTGMIEAIAAYFDIKPALHPEIEEIKKPSSPTMFSMRSKRNNARPEMSFSPS
jgi:uncharacterized membrane protein